MKGACVKAWVLLPVWMTGEVRVEPTLHLQSLDLSSCHLHVYGDVIDTIVCFGIFLSATGIYLWTTFSLKYLSIGSYQLLKRWVWSTQPSFSALVPMSEQQDTYVVKFCTVLALHCTLYFFSTVLHLLGAPRGCRGNFTPQQASVAEVRFCGIFKLVLFGQFKLARWGLNILSK